MCPNSPSNFVHLSYRTSTTPYSTRNVSLNFSPRSCFENLGVQPSRLRPLNNWIHSSLAGSFFGGGVPRPRWAAPARVTTEQARTATAIHRFRRRFALVIDALYIT